MWTGRHFFVTSCWTLRLLWLVIERYCAWCAGCALCETNRITLEKAWQVGRDAHKLESTAAHEYKHSMYSILRFLACQHAGGGKRIL